MPQVENIAYKGVRVKRSRTLPVQIPVESTKDRTFIVEGELNDPKPKINAKTGLSVIANPRRELMVIESKKQED